jgi:dihydrodipicolinate synthase/N-acetylneuraminate lyase
MSAVSSDRITGTLAAAVTPLRDRGRRLDEQALVPLLDFYGASGIDGVLVLGTTGEGMLLEIEERRRVAQLAVEAAGSLAVIVHCGAQTTAQTTALAAHAAEIGADGVAVIGPPYFALTPDELLEHFAAAATVCAPLPFYVYEYADRSGYAVPVEVVQALRERADNLVGMKVSDAPFARVEPYLSLDLDIFIGAEAVIPEGLARGAVGSVSAVAAAFPEAVSALVRDPTPERAAIVRTLRAVLSVEPFQASVKAALGLRGLPVRGDVREPLRPLASDAVQLLARELEQLARELEQLHEAQALGEDPRELRVP